MFFEIIFFFIENDVDVIKKNKIFELRSFITLINHVKGVAFLWTNLLTFMNFNGFSFLLKFMNIRMDWNLTQGKWCENSN